jgi:dTDP-4-dehydrorhamnose reductase
MQSQTHHRPAPTPPLPLLVTGVAGVAGYNAFHYFRQRFGEQVVGIRQADNWPLAIDGVVACDAEDRDSLARLFDEHQFAAVINCAGSCKLKSCELSPAMAWRVNVEGIETLLDVIGSASVRTIHLSIDLVYSGTGAGGHIESDRTDPVTVYGKSMVVAERLLLSMDPRAAVLRISLPMGVSFNGHAGAIDWIQSRFKNNKPATLYYDEIRTPTYTDCLNRACADVLARDLNGLFHAGGPRALSLYQIAQIINRVGGYRPELLHGCLRHQAGPMPPRAGDVSMDSSKLRTALGCEPFDPWPFHADQAPTDPKWHFERTRIAGGALGSPALLNETLYRNPGNNDQLQAAATRAAMLAKRSVRGVAVVE